MPGSTIEINGNHMETVGDRLQQLQDAASRKLNQTLSNRQIARDLGISPSVWGEWKKSDDLPKTRYLEIAQYFSEKHGVTTSWRWIRDGDQSKPARPLDWKLIFEIVTQMRQLCEEQGWTLDDEAFAHLVSKLYPVAEQAGEVDPATVHSYVEMVARKK